jgi:acyl-ACP thioesterase
VHMNVDTTKATQITTLVLLDYNKHISQKDRETLSNWLKVRLDTDSIDFVFRKK